MFIQRQRNSRPTKRVVAEEEVMVAPEATDLLFEAEDVAELVAEITGDVVDVTADGDVVTFAVGESEFVVTAEGDEEVLETSRRNLRGRSDVKASARRPANRGARTIRKTPSTRTKQ